MSRSFINAHLILCFETGKMHAGFDFGQGEESNYFLQGERGYHQQWDSRLYNYKNWEVLRYLLSNIRWWLDEYQCVPIPKLVWASSCALCL